MVRPGSLPEEVVVTLGADALEAQVVPSLPHHARDFVPAGELSTRFASAAGRDAVVSRAFVAAHPLDPADPLSPAAGVAAAEEASGMLRIVRVRVPDAASALTRLRASGFAESAHPVMARAFEDPDPLETVTRRGAWTYRAARVDEAHALERGSEEVLCAVLDTGVEVAHPEIAGRLERGYDFVDIPDSAGMLGDVTDRDEDPGDEAGHGTHVAGVLGARGLRMPAGVAGQCRLLPVRVLGTTVEHGRRIGIGVIPDIDDGIKWATDQGAHVINLSLGLTARGPGVPHRRAVGYARMHDVVVVAASGNAGSAEPVYPGAVPGVITVGALDEIGRAAGFSSFGPHVDVVAPGTAIWSCDLAGGYRYRSGTSHAAPIVSGVAALIVSRAHRQGLRVRESTVRRIIRSTADAPGRGPDLRTGAGAVNALDAVLLTSHLIRRTLERRRTDRRPLTGRLAVA